MGNVTDPDLVDSPRTDGRIVDGHLIIAPVWTSSIGPWQVCVDLTLVEFRIDPWPLPHLRKEENKRDGDDD